MMDSSENDSSDSGSIFCIEDSDEESIYSFLSDDEKEDIKEIDTNIARLLGPPEEDNEKTDGDEEDESVTDICTALQNCLKLNKEKQRILREALAEIQRSEEKIDDMDAKLKQLLIYDNHRVACKWWGKDHTGRFDKPYFKDKRLFPPPPNPDTITKINRGELDIATVVRQVKWKRWEMKLLDDAVRENAYEILLAPLTARKEKWENEISVKSNINQDTSALKEKLANVQKEIKELTGQPLFNFLSNPDAKIDWMKISASDFDGRRSSSECRGMWRMCLMVGVNRKPWTKEETERLMNIVHHHDYCGWEEIAKELGERTSYQCYLHCQVVMNRERFKWTATEDRKLKYFVKKLKQGRKIPFTIIARYLPGRTAANVRQRWRDTLNPSIRLGKFTVREDLILATARYAHEMNFRQIADLLPGRTEKQLRCRYNCLENIHPSNRFTPEEDKLLVTLAHQQDANWADIAEHFTLRSRAQLRGRYMRLLKNAKIGSKMTTKYSIKKSLIWQTLNDKINSQKALYPDIDESTALLSVVQKPFKPCGRKVKHRDKFDKEISQIFRSHYAQPKGRKKKHYTNDDITMIGEKGRQIANVLKANVNWAPRRESKFQDASQYYLYSELHNAHESSGWDCKGTKLTQCLPPNVATLVGLRTLLLVEPFLLRWSFESKKKEETEEAHTKSKCGDQCTQLDFEQACKLFKQRCLSLFLWPMILSQQGPPRKNDVFLDRKKYGCKYSSDEEDKNAANKPKITKRERKRQLKSRWQKYREDKETMEPQQTTEASTSGTQATPQEIKGRPGRKKTLKSEPPVLKPKGKPGRKRKLPVSVPPEESPEVKKCTRSSRNRQGKHVPKKS